MKNFKTTVNLWSKIDDNQAANLSGGVGYMKLTIAGGIGTAQTDGDDSSRVKVYEIGNPSHYYSFRLHKCKRHHYY